MPTQKNGIFRIYIEPKNMTVTLTKKNKKKQEKLLVLVKQILNSKRVKIRDIAKVLGTFEAVLHSIKCGTLICFSYKN